MADHRDAKQSDQVESAAALWLQDARRMGKLFRHKYVGHCVIHAAGGSKSKDVPAVSKDDVAARGHEYANIWIPVRSTAWRAVFYDDGARMNEGRVLDAAAITPAALKAKSV